MKTKKAIRNLIFAILSAFALAVMLSGLFMLANGSLEMYPTQEDIEKVRICGWLFTVVGAFFELFFAIFLYKNNKRTVSNESDEEKDEH